MTAAHILIELFFVAAFILAVCSILDTLTQ